MNIPNSPFKPFIERFETLLRARDAIAEDMSELRKEAKELNITPSEIKAIKAVARMRIDTGKLAEARDDLAALHRVSLVFGIDLDSDLDDA